MSEARHTPGPWFVDYDEDDRPVGITAPNDLSIPGAVGHIVRRNGIGLPSSETAKANAHLISAAPDLLGACRDALDFCEAVLARYAIQELYTNLELAIAKTEGVPEDELQRRRAAITKAKGK